MKKILFLFLLVFLFCTSAYAEEVVVGIAPDGTYSLQSMRPDCPELTEVMSEELQDYVWFKCCQKYPDSYYDCEYYYVFAIGVIDFESDFNISAKSPYGDYGLMQVNSCNWKTLKKKLGIDGNILQLRGNAKMAIDCGFEVLNECVDLAGGVNEIAYRKYNGGPNCKYSNSTSRKFVREDWQKWKDIFYKK